MSGLIGKRIRASFTALAVVLVLAGCTVGPDYQKPRMDLPESYKEDGQWKEARPADVSPRGPWWNVFADEELDRLMEILNRQNVSIEQAEAQYRQSQALLRQARAGLAPSLSATTSASRGVLAPGAKTANQFSLEAIASWEIDLWGGIRRSIEAGEARKAASAAQLAGARLSSQTQLATAYLELRVADRQLDQLRESEETLRQTLQITKNQYAVGIVSQANVALAESSLKAAEAQRVQRVLNRRQLEHAIAILLGLAPADFSLPPATTVPHLPQIPGGLPSTLLERRPDIASAERNMAAANAQIGVAVSGFFPNLTLSGSAGFRSTDILTLISAPQSIWSIGPQLAGPLFDGGLHRALTDEAIATYDASVATYRQTVLNALQAVEDNLAAQNLLAQEADLQQAALAAARRAEQITLNQYRAGTVAYIGVLAAQNARILAENILWNVRNSQYGSSVALISALGGSW